MGVGGDDVYEAEVTVSKNSMMRISKTIETQTNDNEFPSGFVTGVAYNQIKISIPETKSIKDGLMYTYSLYKIITTLIGETEVKFEVNRRYSDFLWLYEILVNRYIGYIIPVPPPKNILTTVA